MKCLPRVRLQGAPHMRQGIPHLGTKGITSHPDCALFLLADWPGRGSCLSTSWLEVIWFRAPPDASIWSTGPAVLPPSSSAVSIFIARTIVKHLSTGPCTGKASRVEKPVAVCGRGQAFGRRPKPVGYTLSTLGRPTGLVGSPESKVSELLLLLQTLWLPSAMANTWDRQGKGPTGPR